MLMKFVSGTLFLALLCFWLPAGASLAVDFLFES